MPVEFQENPDRPGLTVVDRVEGRQFPLATDRPSTLDPGTADRFREPLDAAVSTTVAELELPYVVCALVRDADGELLAECQDFADEAFPDGEYEVELTGPLKLFVRVAGPLTVTSTSDEMRLSFEGVRSVELGARSRHERPAGTVTTTAAPADLMTAVSTFGSALKTTSPERSFPTLRGHPPAIELGDELEIPEGLARPETGLRIEVPRDRASVYAVATLAHYLGARVQPGAEPRLLADGEVIHTLDGPDGLERAVDETLTRLFVLDCVVRTEGRYRIDLHERRRLAERLDLPHRELYDAPLSERVERYLNVPSEPVLAAAPDWYLSAHCSPRPATAELLPYAANALALIRVEAPEPNHGEPAAPPGYDAFVRSETYRGPAEPSTDDTRYVEVAEGEAIERVWIGPGRSVNANDLHPAGVRNRLAQESAGGPIEITIVCNDERMADEIADGGRYGDRDELPFEVTVRRDLSRAELRAVLASDLDFLHYVGHVERAGFVCRDGRLDAEDLTAVGVDTFLLNGCRSYDQGLALLERGGVGGIVTHGAVENRKATGVGTLVAGLLNAGFTLRAALSVAGHDHAIEGRYTIVGDGGVQVTQSENGTPNLIQVEPGPANAGYEVRIRTYPALGTAMGSVYSPFVPGVSVHHLVGGELPPVTLSVPEVVNLLGLERFPAIIDDELRWSTGVSPADLP